MKILKRIAVVSVNRDKYSETFIHDSYDAFAGEKVLLYGDYLPTHYTHDRLVEGESIPPKPLHWAESPPQDAARAARENLEAWLASHRPDVVLAHYGPSGVAMAPICKALGIPLVVHFHGYDAFRADVMAAQGQSYPEMFQTAAAIVASSRAMVAQLQALGAPPGKLRLHIYGVDLDRFAPQPMPAGPPTLLFIGRLVPKKGPLTLVQAFAAVRALLPQVRLRIAGDGELLEACRDSAAALQVAEAITFLGPCAHAQVPQLLADCHALVLPSQHPQDGDSEGTPLVVLEAGAAGRAVIASHHGGIPDAVVDGHTGLLVPEQDVQALTQAMLRLAQDLDLAARMGEAARAHIEANFSQAAYHYLLFESLETALRQRKFPKLSAEK